MVLSWCGGLGVYVFEQNKISAMEARLNARFDKLEKDLEERDTTIKRQEEEIAEKNQVIAHLEKRLENFLELEEEINKLKIMKALQDVKEKSFDKLLHLLRQEGLGETEIPKVVDKLTRWYSLFNSDMPENPLLDPVFF